MRTRRTHRLLAAVLSTVMILSLLVVPAGAEGASVAATEADSDAVSLMDSAQLSADGDLTGAVGDSWSFINSDFAGGVDAYKGLTFSQSLNKNGNQHGVDMKTATITIPVTGSCNIEVVPSYKWDLTIGTETYKDAPQSENTTAVVFHYQGEAGTVNLVANSQTYLRSITIATYSVPSPSVTIAKEELAVVGTASEVEVSLANAPAEGTVEWTATPADANIVASAAIADGKLTFTPVAAGKTTIAVKATVNSVDYEGSITVFARPAEQSELSGNALAFTDETLYKTTGETLWSGALNWNGTQHGATVPANSTLTLKVPDGKKATLVVSTCQYGAGTAATVTATSDGIDLTVTSDTTKTAAGDNAAGGAFTIEDATGTVVLTFGSSSDNKTIYVHDIAVTLTGSETSDTGSKYVEEGLYTFAAEGVTADTVAAIPGLSVSDNFTYGDADHGIGSAPGSTITLNLKKAADIVVVGCANPTDGVKNLAISSTSGEVTKELGAWNDGETNVPKFTVAGASGETTLTLTGVSTWIHSIQVTYLADDLRVQVWDFGAETLDETKFNNMLTVDAINTALYGAGADLTAKQEVSDFTVGDLSFNGGGKSNHRLRTDNDKLGRWDSKTLTGDGKDPYVLNTTETAEDGTETSLAEVYHGYLYSNYSSSSAVKLSLANVNKGDKLTYIVSSNGGEANYTLENASGWSAKDTYAAGSTAKTMTFYPPADGTYSLYCTDEKLAVGRIYREIGTVVTVSGTVTLPEDAAMPDNWKLVFTDDLNGAKDEVTVTGGSYTVDLFQGHSYSLSLTGADEFVVETGAALDLTAEEGNEKTHSVGIVAVPMAVTTVTVSGVSDTVTPAASARIVFTPTGNDAIYQPPTLTVANGEQTVNLEKGRTYTVSLINANDYAVESTTPAAVVFDSNTADLSVVLELVPTYAVTIEPSGLTLADLADATFTFTNISETFPNADGKAESYAYTFTGPGSILLRDGQYAVKVATSKGRQKLTPDVKVDGAATTRAIAFETDITAWDFSDSDWTATAAASGSWYGLTFTGVSQNKIYALSGAGGSISVPVSGPCKVVVSYCYAAAGTVGDVTFSTTSNSTDDIRTAAYSYTGEAGTVAIATTGTTYITKIEVVQNPTAYQETLTVGADKDYQTVQAAVDAVAKMDRPNSERVTILIDPGDYEEQVKVDVPNITFKNASTTPSIALKDGGVNIDENAVRITWYYGQYHNYYSMTTGGWYDPDVLAVNQENGYLTYANKGGSQGTLWTSTVTVMANGFQAEGIIFENSYNQYVSAAALKDTIVPTKTGMFDYTNATLNDTTVQKKTYVAQAAALGIANNVTENYFDNCAFVGHQDVIYGGKNAAAAFYDCDAFGACDYIFGPMTAVFAKCDLVLNVGADSDEKDVAYITAPQNESGVRGYLMYNCNIRAVEPETEMSGTSVTAVQHGLGRCWSKGTGEAVFYETTVGVNANGASLIFDEGWNDGLAGASDYCAEYHTHETAETYDHSKRIDGGVLAKPETIDGASLTDYAAWLGGWDPFTENNKDMTVACPDVVPVTAVTAVTVTAETEEVAVGGTLTLTATVTPDTATEKGVTWTSSDDTVATVDATTGKVTGVAAGTVTITATSVGTNADGETVTGSITLTVAAPTDALADAIEAAKAALEKTKVSETNGSDVYINEVWTTQADRDILDAAIKEAEAVAEDETATDADKTAAADDLNAALAEFVAEQEAGTKRRVSSVTTTTGCCTVTTTTETVTNDNGDVAKIVTKPGGDKEITVTNADGEVVAEVSLPAAIPAPATKFVDVPEGHWAEASINNMAGLGLVKGVNEAQDLFDMTSTMTRASVATIFYRLSGSKAGFASAFEDVAEGQWYADAVGWAAKTGVVTGYSDTAFGPDDTITRQQLAVMLRRYANLIGTDATADADALAAFADADEAADWAADGLAWCVENGIMEGRGGDVLDPAAPISRAEAAAMFDRMIALMRK